MARKTIFITGGGSGIGRAVARSLSRQGHAVLAIEDTQFREHFGISLKGLAVGVSAWVKVGCRWMRESGSGL